MRLSVLVVVFASSAGAVTYQVGPTRTLTQLTQINQSQVMPGDSIEVDGDFTYAAVQWNRSGTPASPIRIVGIRVNGVRPRLSGGTNTMEVQANDVMVEGFEFTGGSSRCFYHHGNNVTLRDSVVRDCPAHGILGADQDSGNFTMEYVEVFRCGNGTSQHQVYMATDEVTFPGSVFRMRYCYLHDANGGNNVKSRAERNELHYNWIEGATFHELELIGPDPNGAKPTWTIGTAREDSEVIGNVLRKRNTAFVTRLGGDATGWSRGRYRFVNNTIIVNSGGSAVFRLFDEIESVEMHNNVITTSGSGTPDILRARGNEVTWSSGTRRISGSNNWYTAGSNNIPVEWTGSITGSDPGLVMISADDLRPMMGSPLINAGTSTLTSPSGSPFPNPTGLPVFHPPRRALQPAPADARPVNGAIDIGAFEFPIVMGGGSAGGAAGGVAGGAAGGVAGGAAGGASGGVAGGASGGVAGGSSGGVAGGSSGGVAGGSSGGMAGGSSGGVAGGSSGGSAGGSSGGMAGGSSGGSAGGSSGGSAGGSSGGSAGGSSGGSAGGSSGGSAGGASGGMAGGTSGGAAGGMTSGGNSGGASGGSAGGTAGGSAMDAGPEENPGVVETTCGCSNASTAPLFLLATLVARRWRRRR